MKDSARLNTCAQMRAEVVDLLRAEAALHMPVDLMEHCLAPRERARTKEKGKPDDEKGKGKAKGKDKQGKETRVCHECNKPGHLCKDYTVYKKRMTEKGGNKEKTDTTAAVQGATAAVQGAMAETWEYIEDDYVFAPPRGLATLVVVVGPGTCPGREARS